jgi:ATP-dependent RNA helicase DHX8/PRP22
MAEFPSEPRVAAMLLSSVQLGCSEEALTVAACCSVESIYFHGRDHRKKVCSPRVVSPAALLV